MPFFAGEVHEIDYISPTDDWLSHNICSSNGSGDVCYFKGASIQYW
jgi:hypothetical protein